MLLYGKPVIEKLRNETKAWVQKNASAGSYVKIILASDNFASSVYVQKKQQYAKTVGLQCSIYENAEATLEEVMQEINQGNEDALCLGIVVQLPLHKGLIVHQPQILSAVLPQKDLDGLGGVLFGQSLTELVNFLPATPKATFALLDFYGLGDLAGKTVLMIGQSNLMGKPFVLEAMRRKATVLTTNSQTAHQLLKQLCKESDVIVTATGVVELVTPELFDYKDLTQKVIIDVGYGIKEGMACGDTDRQGLATLGAKITPVPGGVGPVTVACLFHNILVLRNLQ